MDAADGMSVTAMLDNMAGSLISKGTILVATSATLIPLNGITALGWSAWYNTDATNYVTLRNGASGADVPYVGPKKWGFFTWSPTAVPYAIANTAACYLRFFIASS